MTDDAVDALLGWSVVKDAPDTFRLGGRFWYVLKSSGQADLSIGGGLAYGRTGLWAPLADRYGLPAFGRRRSWMLVSQGALIACIALLGTIDPVENVQAVVTVSTLLAFLSASQDIAIDAYTMSEEMVPPSNPFG